MDMDMGVYGQEVAYTQTHLCMHGHQEKESTLTF